MMAETVVTVDPPNIAGGSPAAAVATAATAGGQAKPESNLNWLKFNTQYFITIPGILKIVQVVSSSTRERNAPNRKAVEAWEMRYLRPVVAKVSGCERARRDKIR